MPTPRHTRLRRRPLLRALLVLGAAGALLGLPAAASAAAAPSHPLTSVTPLGSVTPLTTVVFSHPAAAGAPARPAAPSGGVCSVPGIGDIGSLFGFCSLGSSGLVGDLNNICQPSVPTPEPATGGVDSLIRPPAAAAASPKPPATLYDSYGMAGQTWAAYDLQCSDMASLIGNNVAGVVFDAAKALDRVTITVYQSAAGNGILGWLTGSVDKLITALGNAIYFPYLAPVVILGAIWLAWHGLIRKRATRTVEGTIWMVLACALAVWLIGRPADFTGFGQTVSNGITQTLNVAFAKLPAPASSSCVPVGRTDPQAPTVASYNYTSGNGVVDTNANQLWTVLVCKPWVDGEFGTTAFTPPGKAGKTVVNTYGRALLWSQAVAANEKPTADVIQAKENAFAGIAASIKQHDPAIYPLFTGKQWTSRLEIAFAALFAALIAGVLVLLIAITLIVLKLGFLLLLVAGPFFLIVGTHPGFGRVIALRWGELLIGVLLKQAAVALVLSVLLYTYSLIMGTSDAVLPWALKILMISLVTVAVFIYRKPFAHLFSAVGYGVIGSRERADAELARAASGGSRNTRDAASVAIPGFAAYRAARWARRNPAQAASLAAQVSAAGATAGLAGAAAAGAGRGGDDPAEGAGGSYPDEGAEQPAAGARAPRVKAAADGASGTGAASGRTPPPLDLPARRAEDRPAPLTGWSRRGRDGAAAPGPNAPARPAGAPAANGWPSGARNGNGARAASVPRASGGGPAGNGAPLGGGSLLGSGGGRAPGAATGPLHRQQAPSAAPSAPRQAAAPGPAPSSRPAPPTRQPVWPASRPRANGGAGAGASGSSGGGTSGGGAAGGRAGERAEPGSRPFWLLPVRRRK